MGWRANSGHTISPPSRSPPDSCGQNVWHGHSSLSATKIISPSRNPSNTSDEQWSHSPPTRRLWTSRAEFWRSVISPTNTHSPTLTAVAPRHSECRIRTEFVARRCIRRGPPWIPSCSHFPGGHGSKPHLCRASGDPDRHLVEERASRGCVDCREAVSEREAYRPRQQASGGYMLYWRRPR